MTLPEPRTLTTEAEVLAARLALPRLRAGDPLQAYRWALSMRLRAIRSALAGAASAKEIRQLFAGAADDCTECGNYMGHGAKRKPSLDHIKALANGGTNAISNFRVICNRCNSSKGTRA